MKYYSYICDKIYPDITHKTGNFLGDSVSIWNGFPGY